MPKPPYDLEGFCAYCAGATKGADDRINGMVMADDGAEQQIWVADLPVGVTAEKMRARMAELLVDRTYAALATKANWSPDEGPSSPSWAFTAVSADETAHFYVKRDEDEEWCRLRPTDAPWFMLATAGSLRAVLQGAPMPQTRFVQDDRLFTRPDQGTPPPRQADGGI